MCDMRDKEPIYWRCRERELALDYPLVMGILNVTPDSFYDGGGAPDVASAVDCARRMVDEGASIVDIGGESTRPGAAPVPLDLELDRVIPVIKAVGAAVDAVISVDTRHVAVAAAALEAGADIINNIMPIQGDFGMANLAAGSGAGLVVMHMRGTPLTMSALTRYADVEGEVYGMLRDSVDFAVGCGVNPLQIVVDPGIGFAKESAENLRLIANLKRIGEIAPVLLGVSRKRFIGDVAGAPVAAERLGGSIAAMLVGISCGASVVRVHDVRESAQAIAVFTALRAIKELS